MKEKINFNSFYTKEKTSNNLETSNPNNIKMNLDWTAYFFAYVILIALLGPILKPCSASRASVDCCSFSNSMKAKSDRPGTSRTSLKPVNGWNNIWSIVSSVSSGRLIMNRILLGSSRPVEAAAAAADISPLATRS